MPHPFTLHVDAAQVIYALAALVMAFQGVKQHRKNRKEKKDDNDSRND